MRTFSSTFTRAIVAILSLLTGAALGAEPSPPDAKTPAAPESPIVIVPYDPKTSPKTQQPAQLYVPYENFLNLWDAAQKHQRAGVHPPTAPVESGLTSARYDLRLEDRRLTGTGKLDLFTGREWSKVSLPFKDAKVSSLTIDGKAAAWSDDALVVEKPGRHTLEIVFEIPRAPGETHLAWGIPLSTATLVALTIPRPELTATIHPATGAIEQLVDAARIVTAALGATGTVSIDLRAAEKSGAAGAPASATINETTRLSGAVEEFDADAAFSFPSSVQDRFTMFLEEGLTLTDLAVPNLRSWTLRPDANRQALDITLSEPAKESLTLHLSAQRAVTAFERDGTVPFFSTSARRTELESVAILVPKGTAATAVPAGGIRQVPWNAPVPDGWQLVGAFGGDGSLTYHLSPASARREAKIEYLYQIGRRQVELFASLELIANGDDLPTLTVGLPAGYQIEAVETARPHEWWREGDQLQLRFHGPTPPSMHLVVHLVQRAATAPATLAIQPLQLAGFRKITGEAIVTAHKGVEATFTATGSARESAAGEVARSFTVLPPLERKRGFHFADQDFAGQVKLTAVEPRIEALWALHAEAHEAWVALSYAVRLTLRQGSTDHARFGLPAALPEARVIGSEVREARSHVEGDIRLYDVDFQNDIYESVEFAVDFELPHTGSSAVPPLSFPGVKTATAFLAVENASEGEMQLATPGLEPAQPSDLPWPAPWEARARLFRSGPAAWSATVSIEHLEKASARLAFCAWAELSTAFRRDGTEWHRAIWHLQNRALQFLPVRLPAGSEVVSVRVAGESVRADTAELEGASAVLIPLIKTKPGELSYDVEAVFRIIRDPLDRQKDRKLEDPDLIGITVERTFWKVWLPQGFRLQKQGGNMEPVIEEVAKAEKLDEKLQELKKLNNIVSFSSDDAETRQVAQYNFQKLRQNIEEEDRKESSSNPYASMKGGKDTTISNVSKAEADNQSLYVANKRQEVSRELQQQVQQFETTARAAGAQQTPTVPGLEEPPSAGQTTQSTRGEFQRYPGHNQWNLNPANNGLLTGTLRQANNSVPQNNGTQLLLNDNVTLSYNYGAGEQAAAVPAKPAQTDNSTLSPDALRAQLSEATRSLAETTNVQATIAARNATLSQNKTLSAARGNRLAQEERTAANGGNTFSDTPTTPTAANVVNPETPPRSETPEAGDKVRSEITGAYFRGRGGEESTKLTIPTASEGTFWSSQTGSNETRPFSVRKPVLAGPSTPAPATRQTPDFDRGISSHYAGLNQPGAAAASSSLAPDAARGPAPGSIPGLEESPLSPAAALAMDSPDATRGGTALTARRGYDVSPPQRIDRRITLAVDFPTEGEPIHFKKVKSAATLELKIAPEDSFSPWRNALILGTVAVGLVLIRARVTR